MHRVVFGGRNGGERRLSCIERGKELICYRRRPREFISPTNKMPFIAPSPAAVSARSALRDTRAEFARTHGHGGERARGHVGYLLTPMGTMITCRYEPSEPSNERRCRSILARLS